METWDLSCKDWEARLREGRPLVPDLPLLDLVRGDRAVKIFNKLRLADVPGTPALEQAGGDWFRDVIRALWGSLLPIPGGQIYVDPDTGHPGTTPLERHIRELFLLVPKKNSKTTYGALLMLTALLLNERPGAPFIMTAPVQDVAEIAFNAAQGAIRLDPVLTAKFHVRDHLKTIVHRETRAELQIMTFDPKVLTGQKCAGVLIDELHVVAKMNQAASAIRQLRGGMLPFPEAFLAFITTQSEEQPAGIFKAELDKARAIRDGRQRGAMLPVLYEFPVEVQKDPAKWQDSKIWGQVTPNADKSISIRRLEEDMATARATSDEEFRAWATQHLNVQIGIALKSNGWVGGDYWEQQADPSITLDTIIKECEVAVVGVDGGGLEDLLGLCIAGRHKVTGHWLMWFHAWMHPSVLKRNQSEGGRLQGFVADGDLTLCERVGEDVDELAEMVASVHKAGILAIVGVDPSGLGGVLDALEAEGVPADIIKGVSQGWKLHGTIKTAERKLAEGVILHNGSNLMNWCIGNAKTIASGNAVLITKQASGTAKIDPLMAGFDAVALLATNPKPPQKPKFQLFAIG